MFSPGVGSAQPGGVSNVLRDVAEGLREQAAEATGIEQPILAVDGKTARAAMTAARLGRPARGERVGQRVRVVAGPGRLHEKSNEITAIPELLRLVDIQGAIITIDAMGTQKAIAAQIIDQRADYVLAVKGNQETLHEEVIDYIDRQVENDFAGVDVRQHTTTEQAHGRERPAATSTCRCRPTWRTLNCGRA